MTAKELLLTLQGAKYIDRLKYQETQPTHKKGFQTSDFSRRDEFSMTFRTEQYRTLLKQVTAITAVVEPETLRAKADPETNIALTK